MRRRKLKDLVATRYPDLAEAGEAIAAGRVRVDGRIVTNPASLVDPASSIVVTEPQPLRGSLKLRPAIAAFAVRVEGRVALDVGAAAGGFTTVLLEAGARRVYAVDVGHGQLLGSLRQDPRVVNLEAVNVAELDRSLVPEVVEVVTVDVSYLPLADAVAQLGGVEIGLGADLVGLVKPMFELRLGSAPSDRPSLDRALELAVAGIEGAGWTVVGWMDSPISGARGAPELLVHGRRG